MLFFDHTWSTILRKNPIIHSKWWLLVQNIINITFIIHISCKIWNYLRFLVRSCPKTDIQLVFCKLGLEHLQVHMGNYHIKICFRLVRYQIPQCYLFSKSKTNMKKWYFDHFTANSYLSSNKKDPVLWRCSIIRGLFISVSHTYL